MKFLRNIKNFLYKADFFYTTELLRYKDEPEFRTMFGGVLSLIIIITLIATFYNKFVDTLNKVVITSVSSNLNAADPTPFTISTASEDKFMFGVEIWHHDLNNGNRYFDVVLTSAQFQTGQRKASSVQFELEPCSLSHWQGFPQVQAQFTRLKMKQWLCLPKNKTYNIQGKYASVFSQTLEVAVKKCTNNSKYSRPCASQTEIDRYFEDSGSMFFTIYFINPLINPSSQQYLTYYLEDNNYIIFTNQFGSQGILFMEEYEITTDESILPYSELRDDQGGIVNQMALKNPYQITQNNNVYCSFSFFKSGIKRTYDRSFQKLDQILSYIGGLFGTIAVALFIVNAYNSNSFEITLGAYLFHNKNEKEQNQLKKYNFLSFLTHLIYILLDLVGCPPNWKTIKKYFDCREEMKRQLDILYLLERVFFLQRTINTLLGEHQVKGLYLHEKLTLEEAKRNRKNFKIKRKVMKLDRNQKRKPVSQRKMTEQTLQVIDAQGFEGQKEQILMDIKSSSNESEMNEIDRSKESGVIRSNKILPVGTDSEYISGSSSSSDQEQIDKTFVHDITKLKKESESGNSLSHKIWQKINPSLKHKIGRITFLEEKSNVFKDPQKEEEDIQRKHKYIESPDSQKYSENLNPWSLTKTSKMKIKKHKQSLSENFPFKNQSFQFKDKRVHQIDFHQNVLIENQLKNQPMHFS